MTRYWTVEYRDNRTNTRTTRYFRERYMLNEFVHKNEAFLERCKYGCREM